MLTIIDLLVLRKIIICNRILRCRQVQTTLIGMVIHEKIVTLAKAGSTTMARLAIYGIVEN